MNHVVRRKPVAYFGLDAGVGSIPGEVGGFGRLLVVEYCSTHWWATLVCPVEPKHGQPLQPSSGAALWLLLRICCILYRSYEDDKTLSPGENAGM
jgi:hypothetical protein